MITNVAKRKSFNSEETRLTDDMRKQSIKEKNNDFVDVEMWNVKSSHYTRPMHQWNNIWQNHFSSRDDLEKNS